MTFVKLGEEARVELAGISLSGTSNRGFRSLMNRLEREGVKFAIIEREHVPAIMSELRHVSDDWLTHKQTAEKGFSLGFFDDAYIARFPVAVLRVEGRIVAFANVWLGADRAELSVDLMRFRDDAPKGSMDGLFMHLMLWGREQGYRWFSLGMAPLSGLQRGPLAKAWSRFGHWVFRYGEAFYNFQGVRAYKEKFNPEWQPRYLAYPGGLALAPVLADITALVAGGFRRILR